MTMQQGNISFVGALFLLVLGLAITGYISWWWLTWPLVVVAFAVALVFLYYWLESLGENHD